MSNVVSPNTVEIFVSAQDKAKVLELWKTIQSSYCSFADYIEQKPEDVLSWKRYVNKECASLEVLDDTFSLGLHLPTLRYHLEALIFSLVGESNVNTRTDLNTVLAAKKNEMLSSPWMKFWKPILIPNAFVLEGCDFLITVNSNIEQTPTVLYVHNQFKYAAYAAMKV